MATVPGKYWSRIVRYQQVHVLKSPTIYIGYNVIAALVNAFGNSALPYINQAAIVWSIAGFVIITITVLATASPDYNSADFVFREFLNETGWPDGVAWLYVL